MDLLQKYSLFYNRSGILFPINGIFVLWNAEICINLLR